MSNKSGPEYEKPEAFVVVSFHANEPMEVYGQFASAEEAYEWARSHCAHTDAYNVNAILNVEED
jgi:hypothetical protein